MLAAHVSDLVFVCLSAGVCAAAVASGNAPAGAQLWLPQLSHHHHREAVRDPQLAHRRHRLLLRDRQHAHRHLRQLPRLPTTRPRLDRQRWGNAVLFRCSFFLFFFPYPLSTVLSLRSLVPICPLFFVFVSLFSNPCLLSSFLVEKIPDRSMYISPRTLGL